MTMTAQITDSFEYKGKKYSLAALSAPIPFDPKQYGLEPQFCSTALYRGFWCEYKITDEALILDKFHMSNREKRYPKFNGVSASWSKDSDSCRVYKGVNLTIPFSGKILLGAGFIDEYYIHMGYQRPYAYKKLIDFEFENGVLQKTTDCSETAARWRDGMYGSDMADRFGDIVGFIDDSFSLDYEKKAWWLFSGDEWM